MKISKRFDKGIRVSPTTDVATLEGEIRVDSTSDELKIYLDGAERTLVSENQVQDLTNKTIDIDNNTVSNIETDNLKAGVLNTSTSLSGASDTQVPSALATKTYVDNAVAGKDQASEISYSNATSGLAATDVQAAIDEVDGNVDSLVTLSGVALDAVDLGTFTGTTIPDNSDNKEAFQALETAHEAHLNDATDAHDASAISSVPSGNLAATDVQGALNELQSDVDTRALSSDLSNHLNDTSDAHDASAISSVASGNLAATDVQGALNELQSDIDTRALANGGSITNADINLGTASNSQKIVVSKDTYANLNALTREEGSVYYATDLDKLYVDDGAALNAVGSGGQGGINHIDNTDFEVDASGYSAYADAAAVIPVDGTGGSPVTTIVRSTSSPLRGLASGLFSKSAANRQGEGFAYAFSIDTADQAKIQEISFDYTVSANFVDGDMRIFIYDVTNATLIEPSQRDILANSGQATYRGYWQAASNSTSYRVIWHVATTSALAYDFKLDNVRVGPTQNTLSTSSYDSELVLKGVPGRGSTNTSVYRFNSINRQRGSAFTFTQSATLGDSITVNESGLYHFCIVSTLNVAGYFGVVRNSTSDPDALLFGATTDTLSVHRTDTGTAESSCSGVAYLTSGDIIRVTSTAAPYVTNQNAHQFFIGKVGAASEASGNAVAFKAGLTGNQTISSTAVTKITFNTANSSTGDCFDTAGAFDTTNNRFVAPESGVYFFKTSFQFNGNMTAAEYFITNFYKNGSAFRAQYHWNGGTSDFPQHSEVMRLNKGDYVEVFVDSQTDSSYTIIGNDIAQGAYFEGFKINNPAQIAPTEVVACHYSTNAGQTFTDNGIIIYEDKTFDSHNAYNVSTGIYTVPSSGKYLVAAKVGANAVVGAVGNLFSITAQRQGGATQTFGGHRDTVESTSSVQRSAVVECVFDCIAGDTLRILAEENLTNAITLLASNSANHLSIVKIK